MCASSVRIEKILPDEISNLYKSKNDSNNVATGINEYILCVYRSGYIELQRKNSYVV